MNLAILEEENNSGDMVGGEQVEIPQNPEGIKTNQYGWFSVRPSFLQRFLSSRWILVFCCILVGTQGMIVTGLSGVVISSIEKRYYLRSSQVGSIFSCYDIGNTLVTLLVSYVGHSHKSKWLGAGSVVLGLGCLLFSLPQLIVGDYEPTIAKTSDLCRYNETLRNATHSLDNCRKSQWYHMFVFVLGQLLIGAGASPVYNLGSAYLDENVTRRNSGMYLGVFYAVATLGPGIGFLFGGYFLTIYIDIDLPDGVELTPEDNSWIGAWYLGYIFGGICALIASIPLLGLPREIPRVKTLQDQKSRAQDRVPDDQKPHSASEFLPSLKSLFTNKVFLFTTIAGTAEGFAVSGTSTFLPKFLESQFHLSSSDASFSAGVVIIPGGIAGMMLGGFLIRRFKWTCSQCAKACTIIAFIATLPIFIYLHHCPNQNFAGVTTSYYNRSGGNAIDSCSSVYNCSCKQHNYIPVCAKKDKITYFSPCHAGCSMESKLDGDKVFTNCSCLSPNITMVFDGGCEEKCDLLPYFLAVLFLLICFTFCNNIPAITVTLRCVPESQGSFALGVQQIITRILAFIPAPIVYGALLDSVCILSETDPCNKNVDRNCLEYQNDSLSYVFFGATMICKALSLLFFALAWFAYKSPRNLSTESQVNLTDNSIGVETPNGRTVENTVHSTPL
ncbi:solute carrier organic anion transporter family member 4C1-like [Dendronephthya gigantea]|uniref:solute carrier organic anion transporter family member 4C1-like n=1 Tax=Dendronephthya gigantea TaxID=151771 RepID=UPI00106C8419|nr:solute carrier organic anion transporter family member 4C1-like [Dendronephthya gigantea]